MRVIMVTPGYYPIKGGTETVVRNLSTVLNRNHVHTDVLTFNMDRKWNPKWKGKVEKIDGSTVFKVAALNWLPIEHSSRITLGVNLIPGRFTNILKQYDIVHFHEAELSFPLFSLLIKKPKILHSHGLGADFYKKYRLSRIMFKHVANLYIAISKQMTNDLMDLGIPREKISYLPNGIDVKRFCPTKEKTDNLVLFVGRIKSNKGLHVLLRSLRFLKESIHLVIIGPIRDVPAYQNMLSASIKRINQEGTHKITYMGALDQADIVEWHQKASVFVLPSFFEGFPVAVLEALSCETPVVATTAGGLPEAVQNHENGILVPPNDPLKLAEAIQFLLENKEARVKYGREGRRRVVRDFSLEVAADRLCKIYEQLLNSLNS